MIPRAIREAFLASLLLITAPAITGCPAPSDANGGLEDVGVDSSLDDADARIDEADASPDDVGEPDPVDPCDDPVPAETIEAVDIATGLFIGQPAAALDASQPVFVDSFDAFSERFGLTADATLTEDHVLEWSVSLFFANGGEAAWIYPTAAHVPSQEELASIDLPPGSLVVPGLSRIADEAERAAGFSRIGELLERDEHRQVFFVGEVPRTWTADEIGADDPEAPLNLYGAQVALYHPWLLTDPPSVAVGPAGAVAGVFARADRSRGPWKSPAGLDATLAAVESLDQPPSTADQEVFAEGLVNALRVLDEEPLIWGARTRENPAGEGRYVAAQRLKSLIEASVLQGTHFAAWEPNDEALWTTLADQVDAFLYGLFELGAFQGTTATDSYFVRADATTTSAADIAQGMAVVEVGFAPLRPAEFHILRVMVPAGTCSP